MLRHNFCRKYHFTKLFFQSSQQVHHAFPYLLVIMPLVTSSGYSFCLLRYAWAPIKRGKNLEPARIRTRVPWYKDEYNNATYSTTVKRQVIKQRTYKYLPISTYIVFFNYIKCKTIKLTLHFYNTFNREYF